MAFNDLFLRAARNEPIERTPVWMMRQAGRYMPEYRAIREKHGFLEMCRTPELAVEVTHAAGRPHRRGRGDPVLRHPRARSRAWAWTSSSPRARARSSTTPCAPPPTWTSSRVADPIEDTGFVMETIKILRRELEDKVPLIGFAGRAVHAGELHDRGSRHARLRDHARRSCGREPAAWDRLMTKISRHGDRVPERADRRRRADRAALRQLGRLRRSARLRALRAPVHEARASTRSSHEGRPGHPLRQPAHLDARPGPPGGRRRHRRGLAHRHRPGRRDRRTRASPSRATSTRSRCSRRSEELERDGRRDPRDGRRPAGPHLQPRPRHPQDVATPRRPRR